MREERLHKMKGRVINPGSARGQVIVVKGGFSFIGDFDPVSGEVLIEGKERKVISNKILVCTTGRGGTIAPFIAYMARQNRTLPCGILCAKVEPLIVESAIVGGIPLVECASEDPIKLFRDGQEVEITENGEIRWKG